MITTTLGLGSQLITAKLGLCSQ